MKVYIANINSISQNPDLYAELLSPRHRARALKYRDNRQKSQFILGRLMAASSGKKYTSYAAYDDIVVVAAASNGRVGIDIADANQDCEIPESRDLRIINLPDAHNKKERIRTRTFMNAIFRLGAFARCRQFMRHGDYVICIASTRFFDMPRLRKFNIETNFPEIKNRI